MKKFLSVLFVIAIILVVITSAGRLALHDPEPAETEAVSSQPQEFQFNWQIDRDILSAMECAEQQAKDYASAELDKWISQLMARTDSFLDEYFNLKNVKIREASAVWHAVKHKVDKNSPSAEDVAVKYLMAEFKDKVLSPAEAQIVVERIGRESAQLFASSFDHGLDSVQVKYCVPQQDWDNHVSQLCGYTAGFETRSVSMASKIMTAGNIMLVAGGICKGVSILVQNVCKKIVVKTGVKVAGSTAAKAATTAIPVIGAVVTIGLVGWDLYDSAATAERDKRDLRNEIALYFGEMKASLLGPAQDSIMGPMAQLRHDLQGRIMTQ